MIKSNLSFLLVFLPTLSFGVKTINNTEKYKPCIAGSTLPNLQCPENQFCYQTFCYPKKPSDDEPLKLCKRKSECKDPGYTCKAAYSSQKLCVLNDDSELCKSHQGCQNQGSGDKCCGDFCCNNAYYDALTQQDCLNDDNSLDAYCNSIINKITVLDAESQICQTDANCTTQHLGEKCCIDDPILKEITLSDEALNWKGQKRCCMHKEGKRTLDDLDLDALIMVDESTISAKIYEMPNKKAYCEGLQKNTQEAFQTCKNLQGAEMGEEFIPPTLPQEKTPTQEKQITKSDPSKSASAGIRFSFFTLIGILLLHF